MALYTHTHTHTCNFIENKTGITLVALVVTIIVLLILAGITISLLFGDNGAITRAQESAFKTEIAKVNEKFNMYLNTKKMENLEFQKGTLNAGETSLLYNTKPETEQGSIYTVLAGLKKDIVKDFEIIKGELFYFNQNERQMKWAEEMGMKVNPYEIINGVLISSDKNLFLMDEDTGTITVPERVKSVGEGTFTNLPGMRRIIIPPTCKEIQRNAFYGNTTLEEVIILSENNIGLERIGDYAFNHCTSLKSIQMPDTIKELGESIFNECTSLIDVKLPSKLDYIPNRTFRQCTSLVKLNIPESVKILHSQIFQGDWNLQEINIPKNLDTVKEDTFGLTTIKKIVMSTENQNFIYENGFLMSTNKEDLYLITEEAIQGNTVSIPDGIINLPYQGLSFSTANKLVIPKSISGLNREFHSKRTVTNRNR